MSGKIANSLGDGTLFVSFPFIPPSQREQQVHNGSHVSQSHALVFVCEETMTALTFFTLALLAVVLYWAVWIVYARWFHPCSKFPGPFFASISRAWYLGMVLRAKVSLEERELHRKYGREPISIF